MSTPASAEAYQTAIPSMKGKRWLVYNAYQAIGNTGMTIRDAMERLDWPYNTTSARIFELAEAGLICPRGDTRMGQTVWIETPQECIAACREERKAARLQKADQKTKALEQLAAAVKRVRAHKPELFEDGVEADLAAEGIKTLPDAFKAGYDECHRIMLELLTDA